MSDPVYPRIFYGTDTTTGERVRVVQMKEGGLYHTAERGYSESSLTDIAEPPPDDDLPEVRREGDMLIASRGEGHGDYSWREDDFTSYSGVVRARNYYLSMEAVYRFLQEEARERERLRNNLQKANEYLAAIVPREPEEKLILDLMEKGARFTLPQDGDA